MLFELERTTGPQVFNKHHRNAPPDAIYIGRGSEWGNPFVLGEDGDRRTVIEKFEAWAMAQPDFMARIREELRGKDLVCFCKPAQCHGDFYLRVANA